MSEQLTRRDRVTSLVRPHVVEIPDDAVPPRVELPAPLNVWATARRNAVLIAGCAVLAAIAALVITRRTAPTYVARASIRIDQKPSQLPVLDALRPWQGNAIATELEILRSRALAEEVVDSLGLQLVVRAPATLPRASIFSRVRVDASAAAASYRLQPRRDGTVALVERQSGAEQRASSPLEHVAARGFAFELTPTAADLGAVDFDILSRRDAVEDAMQRGLQIAQRNKDADIVDVSYRGSDAQLASQIVNLLTRRFVEGRQDERHAEARSIVAFLGDQIQRVSEQLAQSEAALRSFREREHVVSLGDEASTGVSRQAELQAQRNTLDAERSALEQLLRAARRSGAGAGDSSYRNLLAFPTLLRSGAAAALLGPLVSAEEQRNELLGRRTPRDPDVQVVNARITQIHTQIESLVGTYLQGLTNQVSALDSALMRSDAVLRAIPGKEIALAELDRNAKSSEAIYSMLQTRLKEAQIAEAANDRSVRIVDAAVVPLKPVSPKPLVNVSLALIGGAIVGLVGAIGRDLSDRSLHTRRELLVTTGVPVVGMVPHVRGGGGRLQIRGRDPGGNGALAVSRSFAWLATNLVSLRPSLPIRSLVVTSALPGDGKTTVAINLAVALAQHGRRILLVDADLRRGRIAKALGVAPGPGLSEVLAGELQRELAVRRVVADDGAELFLLPAGAAPKRPTQLLATGHLRELIEWAEANYDLAVIDSSPMNVAADAALIGPQSDGVIVVARAGSTERAAIALAMEQLALVNAPVAGAVLNDVDLRRDAAYDRSYRYYGRYGSAPRERVVDHADRQSD